jgi:hypothetical protein
MVTLFFSIASATLPAGPLATQGPAGSHPTRCISTWSAVQRGDTASSLLALQTRRCAARWGSFTASESRVWRWRWRRRLLLLLLVVVVVVVAVAVSALSGSESELRLRRYDLAAPTLKRSAAALLVPTSTLVLKTAVALFSVGVGIAKGGGVSAAAPPGRAWWWWWWS